MSEFKDKTIVAPPDGKGQYQISVCVKGSMLWIDAFSDHSHDPCLQWVDGEWKQREPWAADKGCSFKLEDEDE